MMRMFHSALLMSRTPSMALGKMAAATRCACSSRFCRAGVKRRHDGLGARRSPPLDRLRRATSGDAPAGAFSPSSRACRSAMSTAVFSGRNNEHRSAAVASNSACAVSRLFWSSGEGRQVRRPPWPAPGPRRRRRRGQRARARGSRAWLLHDGGSKDAFERGGVAGDERRAVEAVDDPTGLLVVEPRRPSRCSRTASCR